MSSLAAKNAPFQVPLGERYVTLVSHRFEKVGDEGEDDAMPV